MGRGSSPLGGGTNPLLSKVTDNLDFNAWIHENIKNKEFLEFGKTHEMEEVHDLWREKRAQEEKKNLHEISQEEAVEIVRDSISDGTRKGWFVNADSDYKPKLVDSVLSNPGTLNAGLNIAYINYKAQMAIEGKKPMSFEKFLKTPQTMYRGDHGQKLVGGDIFLSFSTSKEVAEGFGKNITKKKFRPIDTWGSYQTTGEYEYLVPIKKVNGK